MDMTSEWRQGSKQNDDFDKDMLGVVSMNIMMIKTNTDDMHGQKDDGQN